MPPLSPHVALQQLVTDPRGFLSRYPIISAGGAAGLGTYYLHNEAGAAARPGSVLGTHHMHATEGFRINAFAGGAPFQAFCVPVVASNVPIVLHTIPTNVHFVVTGELSGCSFIVQDTGGQLDCAHLRPTGETGVALESRLAGYSAVYGHGAYNRTNAAGFLARNATVLGVRTGGRWKFYAQKRENPARMNIVSVHRFFP